MFKHSDPAKYIVTTGGFDTDSNTLKEAERQFKLAIKKFPHVNYGIYKLIKKKS